MPSLSTVRASNASLHNLKKITALFVGGTSGIGQSTLRQLAKHADGSALTAYIIGRNRPRAEPFLSELKKTSPSATFHFIEADVSLVKNVDRACQEIKRNEKNLDFLFMTPGGISLGGRNETPEGIDTLFSLRYYARMRFIQNLLPLLNSPKPQSSASSRIISVYGGGFEYSINPADLPLKHTFSLINAYKHSITMTTLSMALLARRNPGVSFLHAYPGLVAGTNIYSNSFPGPVAAVYNYGFGPLMYPFSVGLGESGERHLFHLSSERYPCLKDAGGDEVARGVDGEKGSGAYLINWKGEIRPSSRVLNEYRENGVDELVWRHTEEVLDAAGNRLA
ncbi:hypothetical protein BDV18DRAFT_159992 [Aspergillus unguis]